MNHKEAINKRLCAIRQEVAAFEVLFDRLPDTSDAVRTSWQNIFDNARWIDKILRKEKPSPFEVTKPESFDFDGEQRAIDNWTELLPRLCDVIHPMTEFNYSEFRQELLKIKRGDNSASWFVENEPDHQYPKDDELKSRFNLYVRQYETAEITVNTAKRMIRHFGLNEDDLEIVKAGDKRWTESMQFITP